MRKTISSERLIGNVNCLSEALQRETKETKKGGPPRQGHCGILEWSMAYQPNDFVNPEQRGGELPAGFKNLNDLLQKAGAQKRTARTIFPQECGSLKDIPKFMQRLYMDHYGLTLAVTIGATDSILWIHNRPGGPRLNALLRKQDTALA